MTLTSYTAAWLECNVAHVPPEHVAHFPHCFPHVYSVDLMLMCGDFFVFLCVFVSLAHPHIPGHMSISALACGLSTPGHVCYAYWPRPER